MSDKDNIYGDKVAGDKVDGDKTSVGDIKHSAVAIGEGATAIIYHLPQPRPEAVNNLPPFNPNFTGRLETLKAIADAFSAADGSIVVTQAISGMGGVGKTQVALAYAHTHRDRYDILWLLQADDTPTLDSGLRQLGETLALDLQNKDAPTGRRIILSYLSSSKKAVLLLYDNADQIAPRDLHPYLPSNCHLLITSRRDDSQWGGMANTLRLGVFTEAEAMGFWQRRLGEGVNGCGGEGVNGCRGEGVNGCRGEGVNGCRGELAREMGYLPLAMEQAAAFMLKRKKSAAAYLQQFKERRAALWAREQPPDNYHATVATTWELGFEHAQQTTGAADLLNLCCFFAPDKIPLTMIRAAGDALPQPLAAVLADEDLRDDALAALSDYSLLTAAEGTLNIHRLVQAVARERMGAKRQEKWGKAAIELLIATLPDGTRLHEWVDGPQMLPHMIAAAELGAQFNWETERLAFLCNQTGYYLQHLGDYKAARPFYEQALAIYQKVLGEAHPDTARSLNNMGGLLDSMGQLAEARPFYEQALAIRKKVLGEAHPDTVQSLNNMGGLLDSMGQLAEARLFYEQALAIRKKVLGEAHPDTARSLNNMGFLLQGMGQLAEARPFYEQALAIRQKVLGEAHPDTAQSLNNLAGLAYDEKDMPEAARLMRRALAIWEKVLGKDHPQTQSSRQSLAAIEAALG